jgi:hypothetical protein
VYPGGLANLYWMLRYYRKWDGAKRRKYYRLIAVEKKRLIESGVDAELVRLACRSLANLRNQNAEARYLLYKAQRKLF